MGAKETSMLRQIMKLASKSGATLFRNQTGTYKLHDGRYISSGLVAGSSDLIGYTPVCITPDMVGKRVAIFTAVEVKSEKGKAQPNQLNFIDVINADGGIAGVVRNENELLDLISEYCIMPFKRSS